MRRASALERAERRAYERARAELRRDTEGAAPCGICGHPIPTDVPRKHPLAWTADHRVPRRRGGANTIENLQPAHRRCNEAKRDGRLPITQGDRSARW